MSTRGKAAFLGLALGDAYGRTLEFVSGPTVRTLPVDMSKPMWTDDTHMSLYLAEACLDHGPGPLDENRFGDAVGKQFSLWLDDPLTPSTAPGGTCTAGARKWQQTRDWKTSGVPLSDGCGAVMRVCPLALAFRGEDLTRAAEISALVTHGHPNAMVAAVAASQLLSYTLEDWRFDEGQVWRTIAYLHKMGYANVVAKSLEDAITFSRYSSKDWLDENAIAEGDGGWRSPSALGLAVAAALEFGISSAGFVNTNGFMLAVEKAARIDGDSDSVACLTGMFLGAAGGVLPKEWLKNLPERNRIMGLAVKLEKMRDS